MGEITKEAVRKFMLNKHFGAGEAKGIMEKINNNPYIPMDVKKKLFETARAKPYGEYVKTSPLGWNDLQRKFDSLRPWSQENTRKMVGLEAVGKADLSYGIPFGPINAPPKIGDRARILAQVSHNGATPVLEKEREVLEKIENAKQKYFSEMLTGNIKGGDRLNSAQESWLAANNSASKATESAFPHPVVHRNGIDFIDWSGF